MADNQSSRSEHRSARGFAAMDPAMQRAIARKGGEAVSHNREHMSSIGRKGAEARNERRSSRSQGPDDQRGSQR